MIAYTDKESERKLSATITYHLGALEVGASITSTLRKLRLMQFLSNGYREVSLQSTARYLCGTTVGRPRISEQ
jgi:hypothetical protein